MIVEHGVHAYSSGSFSVGPGSYVVASSLDSVLADTDGYFNPSQPSRITFPNGGPHLTLAFPALFNPGYPCKGQILVNGSPVAYEYPFSGFAAGPLGVAGCMPIWLADHAPGDYLETRVGFFPYEFAPSTRSGRTQIVSIAVDSYSAHVGAVASSGTIPRTYGTVVYDPHGMQTSATRLEAKKAGYYLVVATTDAPSTILLCKNGSASPLNGSWGFCNGEADHRMDGGAQDYVVGWFDVGDYIEVKGSGTVSHRQLIMVYLGDSSAILAYSYHSVDFSNSGPLATAILRTDSEYIDTGGGHANGDFSMLVGHHFGLAKIATNGGTFVQNDGVQCRLNGSLIANPISTGRHSSPAQWTAIAAACFDAAAGDIFTGYWIASGTFIESSYAPYTNVFVTDAAPIPAWVGQIYRRV